MYLIPHLKIVLLNVINLHLKKFKRIQIFRSKIEPIIL
jgi:hypothetical protein